MKRTGSLVIVAVLVGGIWAQETKPVAEENPPQVTREKPIDFWMKQKLEYSKNILEALTKEDFAMLEQQARQMRLLGRIEGFVRRKSPSYNQHHQSFDLATQDIIRQAGEQNVEGATLAFQNLTTTCVVCHKSMRQHPEMSETKPEAPKSP